MALWGAGRRVTIMSDRPACEIEFKTAVVGVDGRNGGRDAIALAAALVAPGGRLVLAAVVRPRGAGKLGPLVADGDRRAAAEMLESERARLGGAASIAVAVGSSVRDGLHRVVAAHDADLLVLGSTHRGPLGRVLLGDDASGTLDGARCAVAIAPQGLAATPPNWRTLVVGDDGSSESVRALAAARGLATRTGATIRACAVVGPAALTYHELALTDSSDALAVRNFQERKRLSAHVGVESEVLEGDAGEAFAELSCDVDLIVIGSRAQGLWGRLATGSTSTYLLRHANCPVLILPRGLNPAGALAPAGPSRDPREPGRAAPGPLSRSR
jgi:nucleotide-binding universal stress UspA family protein